MDITVCMCERCWCCLFAQKKDTGQMLLDRVFKHLQLHEKDYFGLQFASVGSVVPNVSYSMVSDALCSLS